MNNTDNIERPASEVWSLNRVKFSVLLALQIPAFFLTLLIFYFFLKNRATLKTPQNYALFILLLVTYIQLAVTIPLRIHFFALGYASPATPLYCTIWTYITYTTSTMSEYLMATISVQRHMLVFHGHVVRIYWKCIVFHHLPLFLCLIYPLIFYMFVVLIYPCDGSTIMVLNGIIHNLYVDR